MKSKLTIQDQKHISRKLRGARDRWLKWIYDLRRRQDSAKRDRARRRRLLLLWLWVLELVSIRTLIRLPDPPLHETPPTTMSKRKVKTTDVRSDDDRRFLFDYAPRHGEEAQEVFDGLTWSDIVALNRKHRPHLFPEFKPNERMPDRYKDAPVHVWTLLDHIGSDYHRKDAVTALKLLVDKDVREWIDACATGANGSSWKDLRMCRRKTPSMTLLEFPRAAAQWREDQDRATEESKRELAKSPDDGPTPPNRG
jgi:hypothetical protein